MNVWPVLTREVREVSRQPSTHRLRLVAMIAFLALYGVLAAEGALVTDNGGRAFAAMHVTLFLGTWVLVPLMAADCLSRERREGTIGLLFLTPLKALDIVAAKSILHALRGVSLWLSVVPVLTIAFLVGGVSWQQASAAVLLDLSALFLALGAGLMGSAWSKSWGQAIVRSLLVAALLLGVFLFIQGWFAFNWVGRAMGVPPYAILPDVNSTFWLGGTMVVGSPDALYGIWYVPGRGIPVTFSVQLVAVAGVTAFVSLLALVLVGLIAARKVQGSWQEEPRSRLRQTVERELTKPILGKGVLKKWLRHALNRNPVGWLEQRTVAGRMVMFGWLAIVIGVFTGIVAQLGFWSSFMFSRRGFDLISVLLAFPFLVSMTATAAGSFRRERENGVLELLLVSPLDEWRIVWGRVRGLYVQFLPAAILLVAGWCYIFTFPRMEFDPRSMIYFVVSFCCIPWIALYFSLRMSMFLTAFFAAVLLQFLVPPILWWLGDWVIYLIQGPLVLAWFSSVSAIEVVFYGLYLGILAVWSARRLIRLLRLRQFKLQRGQG